MSKKRPLEEEDDFYLEPALDDDFAASDADAPAEEAKTAAKGGKKNKRQKTERGDAEGDGAMGEGRNGQQQQQVPAVDKKTKRKMRAQKLKDKFRNKDRAADDLILSGHASHCAYWNAQYEQAFAKSSALELEEAKLQDEHFVAAVDEFQGERSLDMLAGYLKLAVPEWKKEFAAKRKGDGAPGRPSVLIITTAAVRAVELIRALGEFNAMCKIGKMFAKHFKPEEQIDYLKKHTVRIVVGTPNRLIKLADEGALSLDGVHTVLIDCFRDVKQRNIFQYHELRTDLFAMFNKHLRPRVASGAMKLTLY